MRSAAAAWEAIERIEDVLLFAAVATAVTMAGSALGNLLLELLDRTKWTYSQGWGLWAIGDLSGIVLDYDEVHAFRSSWRFLPSFDHPTELSKCFVSGVGNAHNGTKDGRPVAPSWFYKGNGAHLRAHGESLPIPPYAIGGAEELSAAIEEIARY